MIYLIQVNVYTALMLLVYFLLLRSRPIYSLSRFYLLLTAVLPFVIPVIQLPTTIERKIQASASFQVALPEITIGGAANTVNRPGIMNAALVIYGLISIMILCYHLWNLYRLQKIIRSNNKQAKDGYILIDNSGYGPGSFGRYVFFPSAEINDAILAHEKAHIKLHHTRDILFLNLLQAIAWPSLLLGRIKKELKEVHEFQADAMANEDKRSYAELLVSSVLNTRSLPEMHLFIIHPLKRRIVMLQKNGTGSPLKTGIMLVAIMLITISSALVIQSCNKGKNGQQTKDMMPVNGKEISKEEYDREVKRILNGPKKGDKIMFGEQEVTLGNDLKPETLQEPAVYSFVDHMPEPPFNIPEFLGKSIQYPEEAKKKNIEGRVTVKFIIDRDGSVTDPVIMRSPDTLLSMETLRVLSSMPKWKPGENNGQKVRVYFTLPIVFRLK